MYLLVFGLLWSASETLGYYYIPLIHWDAIFCLSVTRMLLDASERLGWYSMPLIAWANIFCLWSTGIILVAYYILIFFLFFNRASTCWLLFLLSTFHLIILIWQLPSTYFSILAVLIRTLLDEFPLIFEGSYMMWLIRGNTDGATCHNRYHFSCFVFRVKPLDLFIYCLTWYFNESLSRFMTPNPLFWIHWITSAKL